MDTDFSTGLVMNKKCSSTLHPLHPLPAMEVLTTLSIKRGKRKKLIGQRVSLKTEASYMRKCPTYVLLFRRGKKKKKKKRTCFQFVFKFSPFYNSGLCKDSFFLSSHKQNNKFKLSLSACVDHRPAVRFLGLNLLCQNIDNGPVHCH